MNNSEWTETGTSAANAAVTATRAALTGRKHFVTGICGSFSAAAAGILLEVVEDVASGDTTVYQILVHDSEHVEFPHPIKIGQGLTASVRLAAGGAGIVGRVTITGYTAQA